MPYQLCLPQNWADDRERRRKAGAPDEVEFKTKAEIALEQLRSAHQAALPRGVALLDAGSGNNTALRGGITALGMRHAAGICATTTVWASGMRRCGEEAALRARPAATASIGLSPSRQWRYWQTIGWREGTAAPLASRFACLRVRPAHRYEKLTKPRTEECC